eukprot:4742077-Pyramimonas_sp.AAC.1
MWLSLLRRARSFYKFARVAQMAGGTLSTCGSRPSAAHIPVWKSWEDRFGTVEDCQAAVAVIRGDEIQGIV